MASNFLSSEITKDWQVIREKWQVICTYTLNFMKMVIKMGFPMEQSVLDTNAGKQLS